MIRFLVAFFVLMLGFALPSQAEEHWPVTVTDAAGRSVTIKAKPKAVLLGTGFDLIALSLIDPDPVSLLAGWSADMKDYNPEIYKDFVEKFPKLADVPIIGNGMGESLSMETILTLDADLAILANWQASTETGKRAIDYMESIGVPVIVVDFNGDPLKNTPVTMRLLGRVLDREEQANAFADFYEAHLKTITDRVAAHAGPGPTVLLDAYPNPDRCCYAYGVSGLGEFIGITGSRNIADSRNLPPQGGTVSSEFLIAADPEVYIATASPGSTYSGFFVGPGVTQEEARRTLGDAVKSPVLANLKGVREGRVHGLWNFFNAVPLNILAAEAFAHWLRPDLFADIDPDASLKDINERFAAVPFRGAYWISLK